MRPSPEEQTCSALAALQQTVSGLRFAVEPGSDSSDVRVTLSVDGRQLAFSVVVKAQLPAAHAPLLREQSEQGCLFITQHVSSQAAAALIEQNINFVDLSGNACVRKDGLYIAISGRKAPPSERLERHRQSVSPSVWQVAYVLLRDADAQGITVRELARRAGLTHGTVSKSLQSLEQIGLIDNLGRKGQSIRSREGMLEGWLRGYTERLRPRMIRSYAQSPGKDLRSWWEDTQPRLLQPGAVISGDLAAEVLETDLVAGSVVVLTQQWDREMIRRLRLIPAKSGPFLIMDAFSPISHHPQQPALADPLLVLAELAATADERTLRAQDQLLEFVRARWPA